MNRFGLRPWLRAVDAGEVPVGGSAMPSPADMPGAAAAAEKHSGAAPGAGKQPAADDDAGDDEGDPNGRGSKRAVLEDLSRERDKRQAVEAQLAEVQAKLQEFERAQMSDVQKAVADRDSALSKVAELEKQLAQVHRQAAVKEAVAKYGIPAAMADRLRGSTSEEILADAAEMAKAGGFGAQALDPSQGKTSEKTKLSYTNLNEAIGARYAQ